MTTLKRPMQHSSIHRQSSYQVYTAYSSGRSFCGGERDAEVSRELKAMGNRFEEASSQIGELTETAEELRGQADQLQDMVQQSIANAGAIQSSGEFPAGKSAREKQTEKPELDNDVAMWRK